MIQVAWFWSSCLLEACATFRWDGQSHQKSAFQVGGIVIDLEPGSSASHWRKELEQWLMKRKDSQATKLISEEHLAYVAL